MVTRIISTDTGIPVPVAGNVVFDTTANSLIWLMRGVSAASTGGGIWVNGGGNIVTIEGSLVSTGANGVELGDLGVGSSGQNRLTLGADGSITAAARGIQALGGGDVITLMGSVNSVTEGVVLGSPSSLLYYGDSRMTLAASGSINSGTVGVFDQSGGNVITISGSINAFEHGVLLEEQSSLAIGAAGTITSDIGVEVLGYNTEITNTGTITANDDGILATIDTTLINTGTISGTYAFRALTGNNDVLNRGTMMGEVRLANSGNNVSNEGSIFGTVILQSSFNVFMNSGTLASTFNGLTVSLGSSNAGNRVVNAGDISAENAAVYFGGSGTILNTGTMVGGYSIFLDNAFTARSVTIHNSGTIGESSASIAILSAMYFGSTEQLVNQNAGVIIGSIVDAAGAMSIRNAGSIDGQISLGLGNDSYDGRGGAVSGLVSGEGGVDSLIGGGGDESMDGGLDADILRGGGGEDDLTGGAGGDVLSGGGDDDALRGGADNDVVGGGEGDDTFFATIFDGDDVYTGGAGTDTLDAAVAANNLTINLAVGIAFGSQIGSDTLIGIENAIGGNSFDSLIGDEVANFLQGGGGSDTLVGDEGRDTLDGGEGSDSLTGGTGKDWLTGGKDGDLFVFTALSDSTVAITGRDVITDFVEFNLASPDRDRIVLTAIDADTTLANNQAFVSIGGNPFLAGSGAGKIHFLKIGGYTLIEMEVNNDGLADMAILLQGTHTLSSLDFFL